MEELIERLYALKREFVNAISDFLNKHKITNLYTGDVGYGSDSPVMVEDFYDSDMTYTLDSIEVHQDTGSIEVNMSSAYDSTSAWLDDLATDTLATLLQWLTDYEEDIVESLNEVEEN